MSRFALDSLLSFRRKPWESDKGINPLASPEGVQENFVVTPLSGLSSKGACPLVRPAVRDIALLQSETLPTKGARTHSAFVFGNLLYYPAYRLEFLYAGDGTMRFL